MNNEPSNPRTLESRDIETTKKNKQYEKVQETDYRNHHCFDLYRNLRVPVAEVTTQRDSVYNEFTPEMNEVKKTTIITGKIEPRNEVNIKPQIGGIITDLYKEPGDYVQAGEVIAKVKVIPDMGQAQFCGEPCASCQSEPQTGTGGL